MHNDHEQTASFVSKVLSRRRHERERNRNSTRQPVTVYRLSDDKTDMHIPHDTSLHAETLAQPLQQQKQQQRHQQSEHLPPVRSPTVNNVRKKSNEVMNRTQRLQNEAWIGKFVDMLIRVPLSKEHRSAIVSIIHIMWHVLSIGDPHSAASYPLANHAVVVLNSLRRGIEFEGRMLAPRLPGLDVCPQRKMYTLADRTTRSVLDTKKVTSATGTMRKLLRMMKLDPPTEHGRRMLALLDSYKDKIDALTAELACFGE